ncbi:MAG TPA: hypothetical protein VJV23_15460 [Candidatus Polarisedimenticolia bacterium]|nr:hypothetical protein [Candidatus Polarisedimenticolia bacterium]
MAQWFWRIYLQTVPPAMLTNFNQAAAHGWFLMQGALLGVVFMAWGLLSAWIGRMLGRRRETS